MKLFLVNLSLSGFRLSMVTPSTSIIWILLKEYNFLPVNLESGKCFQETNLASTWF